MTETRMIDDTPEAQAEALAGLKVGDEVVAIMGPKAHPVTISGEVWSNQWVPALLDYSALRNNDGTSGSHLHRIVSVTPAREPWEDAEWVVATRPNGNYRFEFRQIADDEWVRVQSYGRYTDLNFRSLIADGWTVQPAELRIIGADQ